MYLSQWCAILVVGLYVPGMVVTVRAQSCPGTGEEEWDGGGADKKYTTEGNWVDNDPPDDGNSCFHLPTTGFTTCEFDFAAEEVGVVTMFGSSPTFFTLHVLDESFQPASLDLMAYSKLEVEQCMQVRGGNGSPSVDMAGLIEFEVATGVTCCLSDVEVYEVPATLRVIGTVDVDDIFVGTAAGGEATGNLSLTLAGGGTLDANVIWLESKINETPYYTTDFNVDDVNVTTNEMRIQASQSTNRKVALDINRNMVVRNKTNMSIFGAAGLVSVDIAAGKELDFGEFYAAGPAIITFTGGNSTSTVGKFYSSANEGASAETCTCP